MRMYVVHTLVETFTGGNVEHEIMNMKGVTDRPAPAPTGTGTGTGTSTNTGTNTDTDTGTGTGAGAGRDPEDYS